MDGISSTVHPGRGAAGLHAGALAQFGAAVVLSSVLTGGDTAV